MEDGRALTNELLIRILRDLVKYQGLVILSNSKGLRGYLNDALAEEARRYHLEVNLLLSAAESGIALEIANSVSISPSDVTRLAGRMENERGLASTKAIWAVETWAQAFDIKPQQTWVKVASPDTSRNALAARIAHTTNPAPPPVSSNPKVFGRIALTRAAFFCTCVLLTFVALWIDNSWYVGSQDGQVTIFKGPPEAVIGMELSNVAEKTDLAVSSLPEIYQVRLQEGINADSRADAERVVNDLRGNAAPSPEPSPNP